MPAQDPAHARKRVAWHFEHLPDLDFENLGMSRLSARFPAFDKSEEQIKQFTARTAAPLFRELGVSSHVQPTVLAPLLESLAHSIKKFRYANTSIADWEEYFRYAGDRLEPSGRHGYRIVNTADADDINLSRQAAENWFKNRLIRSIKAENGSHRHMLIGHPGCGKSTLMKFLINTHWGYLQADRLVFSRFEFMKFMHRGWWRDRTNLPADLDHYISFILLRDLIALSSYDLVDGTHYRRKFGNDIPFCNDVTMERLKAAMLHEFKTCVSPADVDVFFSQLKDIVGENGIDAELLRRTDQALRVCLIATMVRQGWHLVLMLDGLDHVAVEDIEFDTDNRYVMDYIRKHINRLTYFDGTFRRGLPVSTSILIVVRENTFYLNMNRGPDDVGITEFEFHRFNPISPRVIMYNALLRSVRHWAKTAPDAQIDTQMAADSIMRVVEIAIEIINKDLGIHTGQDTVYEVFGGNIRRFLRFVGRLLAWLLHDVRNSAVLPEERDAPEKLIGALIGKRGVRILKRRKYRLVEMLLFTDLPWFENAVIIKEDDAAYRHFAMSESPATPFEDNARHSGFLDNVLNYHTAVHDKSPTMHPILEKVRIIQLLRGRQLRLGPLQSGPSLQSELSERFGYVPADINWTIAILLRANLIHVHVGQDKSLAFTATRRGLFVVDHLLPHMSYLEHVFYQTMLPSILIEFISGRRRDENIDEWTYQSIRNVYVLCAYFHSLEQGPNAQVPPAFRVHEHIRRRVARTVDHILMIEERKIKERIERGERVEGAESVASQALRLIENQITNWKKQNLIHSRPARQPS